MTYHFLTGNDRNLTRKTFFWTAASGCIYALSSLIFLAVISHLLGEVAAGIYATGSMIAQQVLTLGRYSVRNYQVSDIHEQYTFSEYFTFRIITCVLMMLVIAGWAYFGGYSGKEAAVILCMGIYKAGEAFADVLEGRFQQKNRFDVSGRCQFTMNVFLIAAYVVSIVITKNLVLSTAVLAVSSILVLLIVYLPVCKVFSLPRWQFSWKMAGGLFAACFALFASSFLYSFINNTPKYAITAVYEAENTAVMMGLFSELFMPVFAVDLLAGFTMRMWLTKMAENHDAGEYKKFKKTILEQMGVIVVITAAAAVFMYYLGGFSLSLIYGTDLYGYQVENVLLMLAGGLVAVQTLFENVLVIYRKQKHTIAVNILSAVIAAVLLPVCVRQGGIRGAAAGYLAVCTLRALGYFWMAFFHMTVYRKNMQNR